MGDLLVLQCVKSAGPVLLVCMAIWVGLVPVLGSAEATRHTTPAGRAFYYVPMPEADRTAIVVDWTSAWAHGAEHPTTAHIGAIMITISGMGGRLEERIGELNAIGAHADVHATADGARGLLVARDSQLQDAAALAREALSPRIDTATLESIRAELFRAVRATKPSAEVSVEDVAPRLLLGDAPLDDFLRLSVDDIEAATLLEVQTWYDAVFAQANATVVAAGVAPAADVAAAVDTLLAHLPEVPAGASAGEPPSPVYRGRTVLILSPDAENSAFGVFGPLPSSGELGGVLNVLALEALDRRIARRLRREFGDLYDISARPANFARDVRLLEIGGEVATEDLEEVLEVTRQSYERFRARGPSRREAEKGAGHAARMFEGVEDVPEAVAQIVVELVLDGEPATTADDLAGQLRGVELGRLKAHVKDALPSWDNMLRVIVAPNAEAAPADCVIDNLDDLETCR